MIIQRCPRCGGSRIRRGYRPTPWWQAIFGRYNLLCNSCNWEFVGLAIPGTVPDQHPRKRKKQTAKREQLQNQITATEINSFAEIQELSETVSSNDSNNQNVKELDDGARPLPKRILLAAEFQVEINDKISEVFPVIEKTDKTKLRTDEIIEITKSDDVFSDFSDESKAGITVDDKVEQRQPKSKRRSRVKRKK